MKTQKRKTQRRKTRKHKMRGGNPTVIENINMDLTQYSQIYIGVGVKWHNHNYTLGDGSYGESSSISTSQLIPSFLHRILGKTLILLIDEFTEDELQETQREIRNLNNREYNFDIRIINSVFDESLKTQMVTYLKRNPSFTQHNLWICNFVKFYNSPNPSERANRDSVATLFNSIAAEPSLTNCVYEWITQTKYLIKHRNKYLLGIKTIRQIVDNPKYELLNFVE